MSAQDLGSFREEVRAFIAENVPAVVARNTLLGKPASKDVVMDWHRALYRKGWVAPLWPTEWGGADWSLAKRWIFEEESAIAGAPQLSAQALTTVGPVLISSGNDAQRRRYLPKILDGSEIWCQGFSEPGAGSDLASLVCRATPVEGGYTINGTKIWTTQAHWSDFCLLLARTSSDGRKQEGITVLIVDMKAAGVSVRPIITLDGLHVLNQCFFDDVFVPVEDRIGEEGRGWSILKTNIGHERILVSNPGFAKALRARLIAVASRIDESGRSPLDNANLRSRVVMLDVRLRALEATALRFLAQPNLHLDPEASLLKIRGTELQQDYTRLIGDALGVSSLPYDRQALEAADDDASFYDPITPNYLFLRKASISAGTNEVQRDIIARMLLR